MRRGKLSMFHLLLPAAFAAVALAGCGGPANSQTVQSQAMAPNQTLGFADGGLEKFTYLQNFDCVDEPTDDLNYNGIEAQSDSGEMQTPICQVGTQPTLDPSGQSTNDTAILYVLVPMFSVDNDQNPADAMACPPGVSANTLCGTALGTTLIKLFGAVPEAYKTKPLVYTDCPTPGEPPGTCTMHASRIDLSKALAALGKIPSPATANVFLPTPNHSHVIAGDRANSTAIWWEVVPILVTNQNYWPPENGGSGITSVDALKAAEKAGVATEVPSNFFLFFSTQPMQNMNVLPMPASTVP